MILCDLCGIVVGSVFHSEVLPQKDLCEVCYTKICRIPMEYDFDLDTLGNVIDIFHSVGFILISDEFDPDEFEMDEECEDEG